MLNGQSAPREGNGLTPEVVTYFAIALGWLAVVLGADQLWDRPLGYLAGTATLLASIGAGYTNRMRDAVVAVAIGAFALLANTVIVVIL
jgi:hypothetical protein